MNRKTYLTVTALILAAALMLAGCRKTVPESVAVTGITLNYVECMVSPGDSFTVVAEVLPENATDNSVQWTSGDENVLTVTNAGVATVTGAGETVITAKTNDGEFTADCRVYSGDILVNGTYADAEEGLGTIKFKTVSEALAAASAGNTIVIAAGEYAESLTLSKSITLLGMGAPVLTSAALSSNALDVTLKHLAFKSVNYPQSGSATLYSTKNSTLYVEDCTFTIENESERAGGYAVLTADETDGLTVKSCTIDNYRYGIYVSASGAQLQITGNTLRNLTTGIGVDVRMANSTPAANYPAAGMIANNTYENVTTKTEFFYEGETYGGSLDFEQQT